MRMAQPDFYNVPFSIIRLSITKKRSPIIFFEPKANQSLAEKNNLSKCIEIFYSPPIFLSRIPDSTKADNSISIWLNKSGMSVRLG